MGADTLGSRVIIGEFYSRLEQDLGASWVPAITNMFPSDQSSETYNWLGQVPRMRVWTGGRNAKTFNQFTYTIKNVKYEDTLEIEVQDLERDKSGQIMVRIGELAEAANSHWASLLS